MSALFRWPEAGRVDRVIPKERLYAEGAVTGPDRRRLVDQVQRIRWAYKLGEKSVRLGPSDAVAEIQVFEIELKDSSLDDTVLASIDRSIPSPIVFELRRDDGLWVEQAMAAASQQAGARKPKVSEYFRTGWIGPDADRSPLPPALDLEGLYGLLLGSLFPHSMRPGEKLSEGIDRMTSVRRLEREVSALSKRVRLEAQFNRKVELRRDLRARHVELDALTNPEERSAEDATWRS
ncbi:MAG: DUF4391 domain-containing protein [Actinobacteria bacterium]|nr:DUF4391 domain-containing protein [Actinomycetota bacterium]